MRKIQRRVHLLQLVKARTAAPPDETGYLHILPPCANRLDHPPHFAAAHDRDVHFLPSVKKDFCRSGLSDGRFFIRFSASSKLHAVGVTEGVLFYMSNFPMSRRICAPSK